MRTDASQTLASQLDLLAAQDKTILAKASALMAAHDGDMYVFDLFAIGALNRAISVSKGFQAHITSRNLICAGALLRVQIDTAARFAAGFLVADPHDFAYRVLEGESIRDMRDASGQKMSDRYLVRHLTARAPGILELYEQACGYVHFSDTHIISAMSDPTDDGTHRMISMKVGATDDKLPDTTYADAVESFRSVTALFLVYVDGWIFTKENPELVAERRALLEAKGAPLPR